MSHLYAVVIIFLLIVGATKAKQVKEFADKVKAAFAVMNADTKVKKD